MIEQLALFPEPLGPSPVLVPATIIHPLTGGVAPVAILEEVSLPGPVSEAPAACQTPAVLTPEPVPIVFPAGVRLIRWELKAPPIVLSESETLVAMEGIAGCELFIAMTLRQLGHLGSGWLSGHWGREELIRRLAACGCIVEIDEPEQQQEGGGEKCNTETTGDHGHSTRKRSRYISRTNGTSFTGST